MQFPKWFPTDDLKTLFAVLSKHGEARLVGGCVRNILCGETKVCDIDIATEVLPHDVLYLMESAGIKCVPTGLKHGTVTAVLGGRNYEITTLREDIETYGRHAAVRFTDSWMLDAGRRDFTINAMYMSLSGEVYDYFGGQADLQQKLVRFSGAPEVRIKEDYLRILRYFRFYSYFGGDNIDHGSLEACRKLVGEAGALSGERINTEMLKILGASFAMPALRLMCGSGVLQAFGIEIVNADFWHYNLGKEPLINLAALLHCTAAAQETLGYIRQRWKLSNRMAADLEFLSNLPFSVPSGVHVQMKCLYRYGFENYINGLKLLGVYSDAMLNKEIQLLLEGAAYLRVPVFPVGGQILAQMGYSGKNLGKALKELEEKWIESDFALSKAELLELL